MKNTKSIKKLNDNKYIPIIAIVDDVIKKNPEDDVHLEHEAGYKAVQRILKVLKKQINVPDKDFKIDVRYKQGLIYTLRQFYHDDNAKKILSKLEKGKRLTKEEDNFFAAIHLEGARLNNETEETSPIVKELLTEERIDARVEELFEYLNSALLYLDKIIHPDLRFTLYEDLHESLVQVIESWMKRVLFEKSQEEILIQVVEKLQKRGFGIEDIEEEMLIEGIKEELLKKLYEK